MQCLQRSHLTYAFTKAGHAKLLEPAMGKFFVLLLAVLSFILTAHLIVHPAQQRFRIERTALSLIYASAKN